MTVPSGILFAEPVQQPLSVAGKTQPNCYRMFYFSGTTKQAPVYTEPTLRLAAFTQPVASNSSGPFPAIFLNPTITYRSQLFNAAGQLLGVSTISPRVGEVVMDLLAYGEGMDVVERPAESWRCCAARAC